MSSAQGHLRTTRERGGSDCQRRRLKLKTAATRGIGKEREGEQARGRCWREREEEGRDVVFRLRLLLSEWTCLKM